MRNSGLFFVFIFLLLASFLVKENSEKKHKKTKQKTVLTEEKDLKEVVIDYSVEYGSFYTGVQTPIIYKGTTTIKEKKGIGIGGNGLPVLGGPPVHSKFEINLGGDKACLKIPSISSDTITGLLEKKGAHTFMNVMVKKQNEKFFIKAFPKTGV